MAVKKQPDPESATVSEGANDWFRQFLKHLELSWSEIGKDLPSNATLTDYSLAALQAAKITLLDSGLSEEQILGLLGKVAYEQPVSSGRLEWTTELNKRRFELIDSDIQGKITPEERLELASLTQRMREHLDSEINLPFKGAQKLHRYLTELVAEKTGLEE
jgi:hypothetical protein